MSRFAERSNKSKKKTRCNSSYCELGPPATKGALSSVTHMLLLTSKRPSTGNTHQVHEKLFSFNVTFVKS